VRIRSVEPDPLQRFLMMVTASATKLVDRFRVGSPTLVQYDLKEHRNRPHHSVAERRRAAEREHPVLRPTAKLMYLFTDQDVLITRRGGFTQVDKWELSKPLEEGFGRLEMGSRDVFNDEPGFLHWNLQRLRSGAAPPHDGHCARESGGEDRRFLHARSVQRRQLRDGAEPQGRLRPVRGYGRYEFWKFDLEHRKVRRPDRVSKGAAHGLKTSSNGKCAVHLRCRQHGSICMTPIPITTCARSRSTAT